MNWLDWPSDNGIDCGRHYRVTSYARVEHSQRCRGCVPENRNLVQAWENRASSSHCHRRSEVGSITVSVSVKERVTNIIFKIRNCYIIRKQKLVTNRRSKKLRASDGELILFIQRLKEWLVEVWCEKSTLVLQQIRIIQIDDTNSIRRVATGYPLMRI